MRTTRLYILLAVLPALLPLRAEVLEVSSGSLHGLLTSSMTELELRGTMDLRDFAAITECVPTLRELDLNGVRITSYTAPASRGGTAVTNEADALPDHALLGLPLTRLVLPSDLTAIGEGALAGTAITELALPATLRSIGRDALYGCRSLQSLTLPASLTFIGTYALAACTSLQSVDMSACRLTELPARLLAGDTSLTEVSLPASLKTIGTNTFAGSGLKRISVPASVTTVGDFAFAGCPQLMSAELANPACATGRGIFMDDPQLTVCTLGGIKALPDYLLACSPHVSLPLGALEGVRSIGAYALKDNAAEQLMLSPSLQSVGSGALEGMSALKKIDATALESHVPATGADAFAGISAPQVELVVADDHAQAWRDADQWQDFKIIEMSDVSTPVASVPFELNCHFEDKVLTLRSDMDMTRVEVYEPGGARVADISPHAPEAQVNTASLSSRIYLVRVTTAAGVRTFKLIR